MSLDDEEDNDLYGRKPQPKVKCIGCGVRVAMGNATPGRLKARMCAGCFSVFELDSLGYIVFSEGTPLLRPGRSYPRRATGDTGKKDETGDGARP